jgi:hypothetical protein
VLPPSQSDPSATAVLVDELDHMALDIKRDLEQIGFVL